MTDSVEYVLVTSWDNYWDGVPDNKTSFPVAMFRGGMTISLLKGKTPAVFVKINKQTKKAEKAWKGRVLTFEKRRATVYFSFQLEKSPIPTRTISKYDNLIEGWHLGQDKL